EDRQREELGQERVLELAARARPADQEALEESGAADPAPPDRLDVMPVLVGSRDCNLWLLDVHRARRYYPAPGPNPARRNLQKFRRRSPETRRRRSATRL